MTLLGMPPQSLVLPNQRLIMPGSSLSGQFRSLNKLVRIFQISPAVGGKTLWDLDADGPLILTHTAVRSPINYSIVPLKSGYLPFAFWGQGATIYTSRPITPTDPRGFGGFVGGEVLVVAGETYTLTLGRGGGSGGNGTPPGTNGLPGGGFTGMFLGTTVLHSASIAIAAGAGGPPGDNWNYGADGGAEIGQGKVNGFSPVHVTGGTQTEGGTGAADNGEGYAGTNGSALLGGNGGADQSGFMNGGGGGGGGYFGGGGGVGGGGYSMNGGGGSNFLSDRVRKAVSERGGGVTSPYWTVGGIIGGNRNNAKAVFF
jgi:hypothetical protein